MRKLLGIFSLKKNTPEQIFEKTKTALQENERLGLLTLAKARGKIKNETKTSL
jgi:hypothetical protein